MTSLSFVRVSMAMATHRIPQFATAYSTLQGSTISAVQLQQEVSSSSHRQAEASGQGLPAQAHTSQRLPLLSTTGASQGLLGLGATPPGAQMAPVRLGHLTTASGSSAAQSQEALVIPFPKLSHVMNRGKIKKWHKKEGEWVSMYDVLYELTTDELVEEAEKVGEYEGTVPMLVEAQEEGYLARILHREGEDPVKVGTPVGLMCEEKEQVPEVARGFEVPTTDVYDSNQPQVKVLTWQSYLAKPGQRDLSCMG